MSKAFSAAIKITFDKEIVNDPGIPINEPGVKLDPPVKISSGDYSASYPVTNAFDASTSTYWRASSISTPYIGGDFLLPKTMSKVRVYTSTSYYPLTCVVQGSNNLIDWVDVSDTVVFSALSGWQPDITFPEATYRYWRLRILTVSGTRCYVYGLEFYGVKTSYDVSGWEVTGYEPDMSPGTGRVLTTYQIYRVSKTPDNLSVILWLELSGRMRYPQDEVMVRFFGDLRGVGNVSVDQFNKSFTPIGLTPMFNPNNVERIEMNVVSPIATLIDIQYRERYASEQVQIANIAVTAVLTDVINLP